MPKTKTVRKKSAVQSKIKQKEPRVQSESNLLLNVLKTSKILGTNPGIVRRVAKIIGYQKYGRLYLFRKEDVVRFKKKTYHPPRKIRKGSK